MPGATPFYGWPYPIAADPLDDAVSVTPQALATAMENTLRSWGGIATPGTWATPTALVGGAVGSYRTVQHRKIGDTVEHRGNASYAGGIGAAGTTMATYGVGFRPVTLQRIHAVNMGTPFGMVPFDITPAGLLQVQVTLAAGSNIDWSTLKWSIV